jgi:NADPH2:quinone reductase
MWSMSWPVDVAGARKVPVPVPGPSEVLIRVEAFGLHRSELHFRRGMGHLGSFSRSLGSRPSGPWKLPPVGSS